MDTINEIIDPIINIKLPCNAVHMPAKLAYLDKFPTMILANMNPAPKLIIAIKVATS